MSKWLQKFLEKGSQNSTDITDRFNSKSNMSVLSVPPQGPFDEPSFYPFGDTELHDAYEERLAISEHDGLQSLRQAERIAYLDSFMAVLTTLPYEDTKGDWLDYRVNAAKKWLLAQGMIPSR